MKTDGTGLTVAAEGNFTDLFIKEDMIYAISREYGLIEFDKCFAEQKVIYDGIVSEFSVYDEGINYTVQTDFTYDNDNSIYLFDGNESVLVDSKEYVHYYQFDEAYLKYWQNNSVFESLCYGTEDEEIRIRNADIYRLYGIVDGQVLYSCNGSLGREILYTYQIDNGITTQLVESKEVIDYKIHGIFYEEDKLLVEKEGKLYFSDIIGTNRQEIVNIQIDEDLVLDNTNIIKHMKVSDIYTLSSGIKTISAIYDKQNWHYRDDKLNITIEKRYMQAYDCNVYVTHIFTTDYSLITTGNANMESSTSNSTYKASSISDTYQTIFAQNTDTFLYSGNGDQGIIFRQGEVVRDIFIEDMIVYFDDGTMEIYRDGDPINSQLLLEKGATTSFSFGPILVENSNVLNDCVNVKLADRNPRSAIGYAEPGHYIMIASDGRDPEVSRGLNMIQLARLFEDEGCKLAYNLDGGMSTTVLFMGNYITSRPAYSSGSEWFFYRRIAEIFYVGTSELSPSSLEPFMCDYMYYAQNYK